MRVLHFYRTSFPNTMGGIEQVINQIASGVTKLGVNVDVLSLTPNKVARTIEIDGYSAHHAKLNFEIASTGFSVSVFLRFSQLAKQADVIHYHFPWPFMDVVHFATRVKKPTVVTYHSDIIRQERLLKLYRPLKHKFLGSMDRIVATSPNYLATSEVLTRYANKISLIPIGLDKESYPQVKSERLKYWREQIGPNFFLFVGLIRYYKGLHILLEAAQGTDYPIVIVGAGPIEHSLKQQASKLGLHNVHFLGYQSDEDKVALLTLSYSVVFPSHLRSEAFGVSLLEGAMYGKPMISSEISTGTSYINIKYETGLVVPPSDPIAFRQAMTYLWEHPEEAAEMGRRAEERYWQCFTAEQMAKSYASLYSKLI
jgi:O-antigen biosynthesis rhamnosyltransferase